MNRKAFNRAAWLAACLVSTFGSTVAAADEPGDAVVDRGRYLVEITGCNDCHTAGYGPSEGQTPEESWLTGDTLGWRGPWGTTYATNLRLLVQGLSEDQWLTMARTLKTRPPMPWFNLNAMEEDDLRAIYQYIRHLGPGGVAAPAYLPPDQEPEPPYVEFVLPPP